MKKLKSLGGGIFQWSIRLRVGDEQVHRHADLTTEAAHKLYADLLEAKARASCRLPYALPGQAVTLARASAEYQQHQNTIGKHWKHVQDSARAITLLCEIVGDECPLAAVGRQHVLQWQARRKAQLRRGKAPAPRTINKALAELRAFFAWCHESAGYLQSNPAIVPKVTEVSKPVRSPSWADYCRLADAMWAYRPAVALLLECLADSGARIGEVLAATAGDVKGGIWRKRIKHNRIVDVRSTPWLDHAAGHAPHPAAPLCPREDGQAFRYHAAARAIDRVCESIGLTLTAHWLRHGRATWDVEAGATPREVQERLSHTSILTTQTYFAHADALGRRGKGPQATRVPSTVCILCHKTAPLNAIKRHQAPSSARGLEHTNQEKIEAYDVKRYCRRSSAG